MLQIFKTVQPILEPPTLNDVSEGPLKGCKSQWERLYCYINELKYGENVPFEDILSRFNSTEEEYILAVRSSIVC